MKTQLKKLQIELGDLKPRTHRFNKKHEYTPYEYDKNIHIIDVSSIKGSANNREDLLVSNFWALFLGLLRDVAPGDVVDTGGGAYGLRSNGDVNFGAAYLTYGTSTIAETFTDYILRSYVGSIATTIAVTVLSDRVRISLSGILPATAYELGIYQSLYDTAGGARTTMLARTVGSWADGGAIIYDIDFLNPWVVNAAYLMYGILRNVNEAMLKLDGSSVIARTSGDVNAASSYLVVSPSSVTWSPGLYNVPDAASMTTYYIDMLGMRSIRYTALMGTAVPGTDMVVNTIGLYQPMFDSAGVTFTACHLVLPLASPITLYAGRNNIIVLRLLAM